MLEITFNNKKLFNMEKSASGFDINTKVCNKLNFRDFYLIFNGKRLLEDKIIHEGVVHVVPRLIGGKGGFGSMLRAIGAQIEKTTNREACRDLSGRRLRDINEERRLKNWIDKQINQEQETELKQKEKLERLLRKPKHEFKDEAYDKERAELPERVVDAVEQGLQTSQDLTASASASATVKRKHSPTNDASDKIKKKRKAALWVEDGLDIGSSDDSSDSDDEAQEVQEVKEEVKQ